MGRAFSGLMLILLISASVLSFNIHSVRAGTITVPDDYPTIQEAINNANGGDTVFVRNGTYLENITVSKPMSLIGENNEATIIQRDGIGAVVEFASSGVDFRGFTIRDGEVGITIDSYLQDLLIHNVIFINNQYGILTYKCSNSTVEGNIFLDNFRGVSVAFDNCAFLDNVFNNTSEGAFMIEGYSNEVANNTILNGEIGIGIWGLSNAVVGNNVTGSLCGMEVGSLDSSFIGNFLCNNRNGMTLEDASNISVLSNVFLNSGLFVNDWQGGTKGATILDNLVNGKPLVYVQGESNRTIEDAGTGQVILVDCNYMKTMNLDIRNTTVGIELCRTMNTEILNCNLSGNSWGIYLSSASENMITMCNIASNCYYGVHLSGSDRNMFSGNEIMRNRSGVSLRDSYENRFSGNDISSNEHYGIRFLGWSENNLFYNNNIANNSWQGVQLIPADPQEVLENFWNMDYPLSGNYWGDYSGLDFFNGPYQNETGSDGIGDTAYIIDANNMDRYPLIFPYGYVPSPDSNNDGMVDILDLVKIALAYGSVPGLPIWNPYIDLNQDSIIDIFDIVVVALHFGETS